MILAAFVTALNSYWSMYQSFVSTLSPIAEYRMYIIFIFIFIYLFSKLHISAYILCCSLLLCYILSDICSDNLNVRPFCPRENKSLKTALYNQVMSTLIY